MTYTAAVRKNKGPWELRQTGATAREVKRKLAKLVGLPVRTADTLPLGRSRLEKGDYSEVQVTVK